MCLDQQLWSLDKAWRSVCHDHDSFCQFIKPDAMDTDFAWLRTRWVPHSPGFMKLNVDGSFFEEDGHSGGGGMLRDIMGNWICGFVSHAEAGMVFTTEASALRDGLLMAWNQGTRQLLCESDCRDLVDILTNQNQIANHGHVGILLVICELLDRNWRAELSWTPREGNCAADCMARQGYRDRIASFKYLEAPFQELEVFLLQDSLGVP